MTASVGCEPGLARVLGLDLPPRGELELVRRDRRLELHDRRPEPLGPLCVDFLGPRALWRRETTGARDLVARALGFKRGRPLRVLDLTAGLGRDAFLLAWLGCSVTACERNPVVHALLADGLARAAAGEGDAAQAAQRITLRGVDARDILAPGAFDAALLDPMFPARVKGGASKKEMQFLQAVAGDDDARDAPALLEAARNGVPRVAVKRPLKAHALAPGAAHVVKGSAVRYDVYRGT
jgi:16S rRNA (guanine1516-N2)-methyltransferase